MRRLVLAVAGCGLVTACTAGSTPVAEPPGTTPPAQRTSEPAAGCPEAKGSGSGMAMIDYVDFVQAFGRQYVAGLVRHPPPISRSDLGEVVLHSRCSFSAFNDRTHRSPGEPRDGDTAFLPAGTPIYAVHGWSTDCRLAAESDGRLRVYLAYREGGRVARPAPCATHRSSPS